MYRRRPAVRICIPFILGIIAGWVLLRHAGTAPHIAAGVVLIVMSLLVRESFRSIALAALLVVTGSLAITSSTTGAGLGRFLEHDHGAPVPLRAAGTVLQKPAKKPESAVLLVRVDSLTRGSVSWPCQSKIRVSVRNPDSTILRLSYGTRIHVRGELRSPPLPGNPGEFDYKSYCLLHGIEALMTVKGPADVDLPDQDSALSFLRWIEAVRGAISRSLEQHVSPIVAGLLKGLVIGERTDLPDEVRMAFTNAGLMHLLAVSGFNVGLVAGILLAIGSLLRCSRHVQLLLTASGLIVFMYLTGAEASVVRATIMGLALLGAAMVERTPDLPNSLAVAALIALMLDARTFFDIGFQLSFAAVLALVLVVPAIEEIAGKIPDRLGKNVIFRYVMGSIVVSLAASAGTIPITALYFHKVSFIGILLNLVAVPISGILLGIGILLALFEPVLPWVSTMYAEVAELLGLILLKVTMWGGTRSYASLDFGMDLFQLTLAYLIVYAASEWKRRAVRVGSILGALVLCNVMVWNAVVRPAVHVLRVAAINVGQGDAILLTMPSGENILVDAGPRSFSFDAGQRTVVPFLRSGYAGSIDELILTHSHADHTGGAPSLIRMMPVHRMFQPVASGHSSILREIGRLCDSAGVRTGIVDSSRCLIDSEGVRVYVLHLLRPGGNEDPRNQNDNSIVLKVVYGGTSILLMGDAEAPAEEILIRAFGSFLQADLIKIGHHGSPTSSSREFIETVRPHSAIISVGAKNKFGHPSPETVTRLKERGIAVLRTDEEGAIIMQSDGRSWKKEHWR
jgi:competence protein ComEC